jgi:GT2 family glycosyltransferase
MSAEDQLLYIVVNYYNEAQVQHFVCSELLNQSLRPFRIAIVDNGSAGEMLKELAAVDGSIMLLKPGCNTGYLGAANFALQKYSETHPLPGYVVLSNVDMHFLHNDSLQNILSTSPPDADVIGPGVVSSENNKPLNPFYSERISAAKLKFLISIFSFYPAYLAYQFLSLVSKYMPGRGKQNNDAYVYALHGSMMIFRKSYFEKGGTFNFGSFLFGEELFIAEICRRQGMKSFYNSKVEIIHDEHSTTGLIKKPKYIKWMRDSLSYIYNTYFR